MDMWKESNYFFLRMLLEPSKARLHPALPQNWLLCVDEETLGLEAKHTLSLLRREEMRCHLNQIKALYCSLREGWFPYRQEAKENSVLTQGDRSLCHIVYLRGKCTVQGLNICNSRLSM